MNGLKQEEQPDSWSDRYIDFLNSISGKTYDFYIAVTRKGYYFAQIQCKRESFGGKSDFKEKLIRDRDIYKCFDPKIFADKKVLLFDDTVSTGETLRKLRDFLFQKTNYKIEIDIAAFAVSHEVLKKNENGSLFGDSSLFFQYSLSEDEMSEFSLYELHQIHDLMTPYVIDLPLFESVELTEEQFRNLSNIAGRNWSFHDYSFKLQNTTYTNGFFLYENSVMEEIFGSGLLACVVKCRYKRFAEKGICKYKIVFTPFVMLKSMLYEDMRSCLLNLYDNTEYGDFVRGKAPSAEQKNNFVGIYRDVIYNLSYFVGEVFRQYFGERYGVSLTWNKNLTKNPQNEIMEKSIDKMFKDFSAEKYLNRLYRCRFFYQRKPDIEITPYGDTKFTDVRDFILGQIALWRVGELGKLEKGAYLPGGYILFESIEDIMASEFSFQSERQFAQYFARIILLALDCSVMSNDLILENGEIKRVFRYGEGSEIYFGYDITLFYQAVYAYYNNVGADNKAYHRHYESFITSLYNYLQSNNYFNAEYISRMAFLYFASYFNLEGSVLEREIRNKRFVLESNEQKNPYYRAVGNFVSNLKFD